MICEFDRSKVDGNRLYGDVIAESETLLLIHLAYDFEFDGCRVIRKADITQRVRTESTAYSEDLMRRDRLWKAPPKLARQLPLDDWATIFKALLGKFVIVEDEIAGRFLIGPVVACSERTVSIRHFDDCGRWQSVKRIAYDRITMLHFESRYIKVHARHLPSLPT